MSPSHHPRTKTSIRLRHRIAAALEITAAFTAGAWAAITFGPTALLLVATAALVATAWRITR